MSEFIEVNGNMDESKVEDNAEELHRSFSNKKRLTSAVWNDFERFRKEDGSLVAKCKHCRKNLTGDSKSGTTHLRRHLHRCSPFTRPKSNCADVRQLLLKSGDLKKNVTNSVEKFMFDQELSQKYLARMIILHEYPFSIVDHIGFRSFVKSLQPQFKFVSRFTIEKDCMKIFESEKKKLYDEIDKLQYRVSVTADVWSSSKNVEYVCLIGHYVDDAWKLQKRVLNFLKIETPSSGESIANTILGMLFDWNLDKKLFSIVMGDCTTNDVVIQELLKVLIPRGSLHVDGNLFRVRCWTYILNLIVQDGMEPIQEIIHKVRESIKYVKSSEAREERFHNCASEVHISKASLVVVVDVPTWWNSTFTMLKTALELQDVFLHLAEVDNEYIHLPSLEEWEKLKLVHKCLKIFYDVTEIFSSTKNLTANCYFSEVCEIQLSMKEWCKSPHRFISSMAIKMMDKFDKYWDSTSLLLAIASILDPRQKMKLVEFYFPMIYGNLEAGRKISEVRGDLTMLYDEYVIRFGQDSSREGIPCYFASGSCSTGTGCGSSGVDESSCKTLTKRQTGIDSFLKECSSNLPPKSDLEMYLDDAISPLAESLDEDFAVLDWWKFSAAKYPILSRMARDILGIPRSVIAPESSFCMGFRVLDPYRSSLQAETIQGLICAQDWIKNTLQAESTVGSSATFSTITSIDMDDDTDALSDENSLNW